MWYIHTQGDRVLRRPRNPPRPREVLHIYVYEIRKDKKMKNKKKSDDFAIVEGQLFSAKFFDKPAYGAYASPHAVKGNATSAGASDKRRADVNLRKF